MTGRVLVTAGCRRGHVLAQLLATSGGRRVRLPDCAAGHLKAGRVHYRHGGEATVPLLDEDGEASDSYLAMCGCGART